MQMALAPGLRLGVVVVSLTVGTVAELLVLAGLPGIGSGRSEGEYLITVLMLQRLRRARHHWSVCTFPAL